MSLLRKSLMTVGLTLGLSSVALAGPIYSFDINNPGGSEAAGDIKNISTSYDAGTDDFSWSYTIGNKGSTLSDGFWLVVTDGENPKDDENEYAIIYGDTDNNMLTVYEYNGANSSSSWNTPGTLLASYDNALSIVDNGDDTERTISFNIDATDINNAANHAGLGNPGIWKGLGFGEKIGVWFHPSIGTSASYDDNGGLTSFNTKRAGWYDTGNQDTEVPEPHTLFIFAIGLLGFAASRKVRRA